MHIDTSTSLPSHAALTLQVSHKTVTSQLVRTAMYENSALANPTPFNPSRELHMNTYASESIIGPPSDRIHIKEFLDRCAISLKAQNGSGHADNLETEWDQLSGLAKQRVEEECR